jgi:hypothetical protein
VQLQISARANQDLHQCKSGLATTRFLYNKVDGIEVCFSLTTPFDIDERARLEFLNGTAYGRDVRAHVFGEPFLAGEAQIVVPGETEQ